MSVRVSALRVQRFKNLEDASFALAPVNVLVGANNSGKSAVLQAAQFSISAAQCVPARRLPESGQFAATVAPSQLYYSPVEDVMALSHGAPLTQNQDGGIQLDLDIKPSHDDEASPDRVYLNIAKGKNGNLAVRSNASKETCQLINSLESPFSMYVPGLAGIAPRESYATPAAVRKAAARGHGNAILRNILWQLQQDEGAWSNFHTQLDAVFPGYKVAVRHDPEQDELVYATLKGPSGKLPLGLAGTGQLQVIQILAYVNLYAPRLLLLDEPDAHIHPDKQRALLRVICEWADGNDAKVLIATHSRHLLDALEGDATFHWMQDGARNDEDDFDRVRVLMDLGALDRSDRLKNGDVRGVVLTEDADASDSSRKKNNNPLRRLLAANNVDLEKVQVWAYGGCTEVRIAKALSEFIRDNAPAPGVEILTHRDRDYLSDDEVAAFEAAYARQSLEVFVTTGTDAESHFLEVAHLVEVSRLNETTVTAMLEAATLEVRDDSLGTFSREEMRRAREARRAENRRGEPNPHEISETCKAALDNDPARYRHGKKTLKAFRRLIAAQHRPDPDLLAPSDHLTNATLTDFAGRLVQTAIAEPDATPAED